jgi:uncharacterized protein YlxP (DUF503 family)
MWESNKQTMAICYPLTMSLTELRNEQLKLKRAVVKNKASLVEEVRKRFGLSER